MRLITGADVDAALDWTALMDHILARHRDPPTAMDDMLTEDPGTRSGGGRMLTRAAWAPDGALAVKIAPIFPANAARGDGAPSVSTLVALFDADTGAPVCAIVGPELTWWKTAADSALGARLLARADARVHLILGAGAMAAPLARAHRAARPSLARTLIWNRTPARAAALAAQLTAEGIAAEPAADRDAALAAADVVTAATMSEQPLVRGARLKAGAHVDLVGAYTPLMREADDDAIRRARLFCDARATALETGEFQQPIASGAMRAEDIEGDLRDLAAAPPGRTADDVTLYKNGGGGHLDLMTAECVARALGLTS